MGRRGRVLVACGARRGAATLLSFVDDAAFVVSPDLFSSSLGDVVPVVGRAGAASVVDDGEDYRTYLVGLGRAFATSVYGVLTPFA